MFYQSQLGRKVIDFTVLFIHHSKDRIPQPKSGDNERGTSADATYGHPEPLLIAKQIPQGNFIIEG